MKPHLSHPWDLSPRQAARLQEDLRRRVEIRPLPRIGSVAGADVAFHRPSAMAFAGVVAYSFPAMEERERCGARLPLRFPYVPGLLSFREGPALLAALAGLRTRPDVILFDAHGIAHPRRFGLASHMGVVLDVPAIGCAKSRLVGRHRDPAPARGSWSPLVHDQETVGAVLRTRTGVRPIFVSIGHQANLDGAIRLVLACGDGRRIPRPTREADQYVAEQKRAYLARRRPAAR